MAKDNPEINPIIIKPETSSHVAELFSWVPLPYCSLPGCPFPIKSLALSAHVSPRTIHFQVLDKSPVSGPVRGPPSCNRWRKYICSWYQLRRRKLGFEDNTGATEVRWEQRIGSLLSGTSGLSFHHWASTLCLQTLLSTSIFILEIQSIPHFFFFADSIFANLPNSCPLIQ